MPPKLSSNENITFELLTELIKNQNIMLLKNIAKKYKLDEEELLNKFLKKNYYIPYIDK
jgi:hypothetical protein